LVAACGFALGWKPQAHFLLTQSAKLRAATSFARDAWLSNIHCDTIQPMATQFVDVDPRTLHVPPSRLSGADLYKLHRQIALFGASTKGMPVPWAYRGTDGELQLYNGVTRATRIAKLSPGTLIRVEVVGNLAAPVGHLPKIGDLVP
jgi:hypothetical protein